jgi:hypothetical protein
MILENVDDLSRVRKLLNDHQNLRLSACGFRVQAFNYCALYFECHVQEIMLGYAEHKG